mmetsp:Transcript_18424/g.51214  ORF Transcript_18424/g.51214 Transcript_18424/m.51214 type:complete len:359 (-) Transcript_18424:58-1134(-)
MTPQEGIAAEVLRPEPKLEAIQNEGVKFGLPRYCLPQLLHRLQQVAGRRIHPIRDHFVSPDPAHGNNRLQCRPGIREAHQPEGGTCSAVLAANTMSRHGRAACFRHGCDDLFGSAMRRCPHDLDRQAIPAVRWWARALVGRRPEPQSELSSLQKNLCLECCELSQQLLPAGQDESEIFRHQESILHRRQSLVGREQPVNASLVNVNCRYVRQEVIASQTAHRHEVRGNALGIGARKLRSEVVSDRDDAEQLVLLCKRNLGIVCGLSTIAILAVHNASVGRTPGGRSISSALTASVLVLPEQIDVLCRGDQAEEHEVGVAAHEAMRVVRVMADDLHDFVLALARMPVVRDHNRDAPQGL